MDLFRLLRRATIRAPDRNKAAVEVSIMATKRERTSTVPGFIPIPKGDTGIRFWDSPVGLLHLIHSLKLAAEIQVRDLRRQCRKLNENLHPVDIHRAPSEDVVLEPNDGRWKVGPPLILQNNCGISAAWGLLKR